MNSNSHISYQHTNGFNKYLKRVIKRILNYEDKNKKLNEILDEIRFPERNDEFKVDIFKNDILESYKVIETFDSENKKINVKNDIFELYRYILSKYGYYVSNNENIDYDINEFFTCLKMVLFTPISDRLQELIINFFTNIKKNKSYLNMREVFNKNSYTLAYANYIFNTKIAYEDTFFDEYIELIGIIDSRSKYNIFRDFLSYDLEEMASQMLEKKGLYTFEYSCIINNEYPNNLLGEYLKEEMNEYFSKKVQQNIILV